MAEAKHQKPKGAVPPTASGPKLLDQLRDTARQHGQTEAKRQWHATEIEFTAHR